MKQKRLLPTWPHIRGDADWPTAPPQSGSPHLVTIDKLCSKSPGPMPGKAGFYFILIMAFVTFAQLVKNIWL